MISSDSWLDISFDIYKNGRYEACTHRLIAQSQVQSTGSDRQTFAKQHGISTKPIQPFLSLVFDRHLQIPVDAVHCLCQGLSSVLVQTTIEMMSLSGREMFSSLVRQLKLPRGWTHFQDPVHHLKSYFFSDLARLVMVGPLVLIQLSHRDFLFQRLRSLRLKLGLRTLSKAFDEILGCWIQLAVTNAKVFASEVQGYDDLRKSVVSLAKQLARVRFQVYSVSFVC